MGADETWYPLESDLKKVWRRRLWGEKRFSLSSKWRLSLSYSLDNFPLPRLHYYHEEDWISFGFSFGTKSSDAIVAIEIGTK